MSIRNTITLNGQSSGDINGLLIQELPPISKPGIRTEVEEIDGRDGDIVTKLGYSAYNKEASIGLYGDFDIDEIIAFFDSEGTVTFSNEPDKFYNYQIFEQIDFERLVRFRTAKVKMHVQPFKYSADETAKTFNVAPNLLSIPNYTSTKSRVTLTVASGVISINGTASANTEFYVPISALNLDPGSYTLAASTSGTNADQVAIRLIKDSPSNANSFGGKPVYLSPEDAVTIEATLEESADYNYLWFYVVAGEEIDIDLTTNLVNADELVQSASVVNSGNIYARPQLTLTGVGTINLSLNGEQLFVVNLGAIMNSITIDTAKMEAYYGTPDSLANRAVDGDYDNFKLNVGTNVISWSGNLNQLVVNNYSRWI